MINFDSLPSSKPVQTIPQGRYTAIIATAEMKTAKDPMKPPYLNIRLDILDSKGNKLGSVFDILSESPAQLVRYKIHRFITALGLNLTNFELKDLTKIIVGKKLEVDLKIEQQEGYAARTVVDALTNEIYYPIGASSNPAEADTNVAEDDCPFDAADGAAITPNSNTTDVDEY